MGAEGGTTPKQAWVDALVLRAGGVVRAECLRRFECAAGLPTAGGFFSAAGHPPEATRRRLLKFPRHQISPTHRYHTALLQLITFARFMLKTFRTIGLIAMISLLLASCKTEFEKVRTSGDPDQILALADQYYEDGKYAKAQTLYELVVNALRGDPRLQEAYFKYAQSFYQTKQYILSSYYFKNYAETYPVSENRPEALYMEAMSYVQLSPGFRLDQEYTRKAIIALEQYINTYPDTERLSNINDLLDELRVKQETKAVDAARLYYDMEQYQSAVQSYERVLEDYPDSDRAQEIRYRIAESHIRLADNSVVAKRRERYENALDAISVYLKKYPAGEYARSLRTEKNRISKLLQQNDTYVRY